jgi:hypothetical protein
MRFANATTMSLVRLGLFLTACAISANSAQAGGSATVASAPDSIEADHRASSVDVTGAGCEGTGDHSSVDGPREIRSNGLEDPSLQS